jgi:uncharacterized membrane protein
MLIKHACHYTTPELTNTGNIHCTTIAKKKLTFCWLFSVQQGRRTRHQSNTMYMTRQFNCLVIIFAFTSLKIYIVNYMKFIIHGVLNSVSFYVWSIILVAILYTTLFISFNSEKYKNWFCSETWAQTYPAYY